LAMVVLTDNDSDPDDDPLRVKEVRPPHHGTATGAPVAATAFRPRWRCGHTPAPGFVGTGDFAYTIADPAGETCTAVVHVAVAPPPRPRPHPRRRAPGGRRLQPLGLQPASVQTLFRATHGAEAEARWVAQHEAELASAGL